MEGVATMRFLLIFAVMLASVLVHAAAPAPYPKPPTPPVFGRRPPRLTTGANIDWQRIDFGALSFELPPGMTNVPVRGIDSLVGRCNGPHMSLTFDFGRYSSSALREATTPIDVGGRPARILVRALGPKDYARDGSRGMTNFLLMALPNGQDTLRMSIFCRDPSDLSVARTIADSVRLPAEH